MHRRRRLARAESALSIVAGALAVLSVFWRDWIEGLTGWDPDRHNGSFEIVIVVALATVAVLSGVLARHNRRRLALGPT